MIQPLNEDPSNESNTILQPPNRNERNHSAPSHFQKATTYSCV